ncbi:MAG: hypothetical protein K6E54_06370 [Bacteroidaceae bacterium]|nr:hypothetical protein [Bacteroidaceae bacterium]
MKKLLMLLAMLLVVVEAYAQGKHKEKKEQKVAVWGHVRDSFTKAGIENVKITIMTKDSVVIDTVRVNGNPQRSAGYDATYRTLVPAVPQHLIIKAEHPDYEDCYVNYNLKYIKRNIFFDAKWHYMKRKDKRVSDMDGELNEVVVKATKVRIAYRGDTIVYNADAFNVPEGSMLDGLLQQMDGVELNEQGEIKVNGRKVDYLTLNGKDFFRGKNKIMLDNLPYYTVKEIKVFEKSTELSEFLGRDVQKKDYVMDVQLKREYSIGTLGNVEAGGGPASQNTQDHKTALKLDRYLARAFGLRFTDNTRITLFGNTNNLSQNGTYVSNRGDWMGNSENTQMASRSLGTNVLLNAKDNKFTDEISVKIQWKDTHRANKYSNESFLSTGSSYKISNGDSNADAFDFNLDNKLKIKLPQLSIPFNMNSKFTIDYKKNILSNNNDYTTFASNPFEDNTSYADTINLKKMRINTNIETLNVFLNCDAAVKLPWGDHIELYVSGNYDKQNNDSYSYNLYKYWKKAENNGVQNQYDHTPNHGYEVESNFIYSIDWLTGWSIQTNFHYNQAYADMTYDYHRLDRLGGIYSETSLENWRQMLPSTRDSLLLCLDMDNTYRYELKNRTYDLNLTTTYTIDTDSLYKRFCAVIPIMLNNRRLDYESEILKTLKHKKEITFEPQIEYEIGVDNMKKVFYIGMEMSQYLPDLYNTLDVTNSTFPLAIRKGNSNLKKSSIYTFTTFYQRRGSHDYNSYLRLSSSITSNAIAQGYKYDTSTGVHTYMPENVNGNWTATFNYLVGSAIDSAKLLHWNLRTFYNIYHCVDLASVNTENVSRRSTVMNHNISIEPEVKYRKSKLTLRASGMIKWINSHRYDTDEFYNPNVNAFNISYGFDCTYTFPWKMQLTSDIKMYSRRGYADESMNIDRPIWNAQITYPFIKGQLIGKLIGSDILGQRTNIDYIINAQGKTETWTNNLGRYIIATLQWKFNKRPKRR